MDFGQKWGTFCSGTATYRQNTAINSALKFERLGKTFTSKCSKVGYHTVLDVVLAFYLINANSQKCVTETSLQN